MGTSASPLPEGNITASLSYVVVMHRVAVWDQVRLKVGRMFAAGNNNESVGCTGATWTGCTDYEALLQEMEMPARIMYVTYSMYIIEGNLHMQQVYRCNVYLRDYMPSTLAIVENNN